MKERRRYPRIDVERHATVRHLGKLIDALTVNLSQGGVLLFTDQNTFALGKSVEVVFDLTDSLKDIAVGGRVIRQETRNIPQQVAIEFTNPDTPTYNSLEQFLTKVSSRPGQVY